MVATVPSPLLEDAIRALMRRWLVSSHEASTAIHEVAEELDLEVIDMAALVAAFDHQHRWQQRSWSLQSGANTAWVMRQPKHHRTQANA